MPGKILIIDDEEQLRKLLARIISLEGFTVSEACTLKEANTVLTQQQIDVILCDVKLPDGNGVDFVKTVKNRFQVIEIILLTAFGDIADGVRSIKNGAFDYLLKGNENDRIIPLLYQAMDKVLLQKATSIKVNNEAVYNFDVIIGEGTSIQHAKRLAQKASATDTTVLLLGETGTGKEIFANAIHHNSNRKKNSMVAINCSAFTRELLEGELFGHKAGAYTGAIKDKKGLVEIADNGTFFLDEIGDLHSDLQAKLLRILENGEFIKLGDTKTSKVNVRIIAATNRDLKKETEDGKFREDLYYRLNVFTIDLPPLRKRKEDIPALINYFLSRLTEKDNQQPVTISKEALHLLQQYRWKGNIRELKNVLERTIILMEDFEILPEHLPYEIQKQNTNTAHELSLNAVEKKHIQKILEYTKGNKSKAARLLEIGLATLYRKMEEYHIKS